MSEVSGRRWLGAEFGRKVGSGQAQEWWRLRMEKFRHERDVNKDLGSI